MFVCMGSIETTNYADMMMGLYKTTTTTKKSTILSTIITIRILIIHKSQMELLGYLCAILKIIENMILDKH